MYGELFYTKRKKNKAREKQIQKKMLSKDNRSNKMSNKHTPKGRKKSAGRLHKKQKEEERK